MEVETLGPMNYLAMISIVLGLAFFAFTVHSIHKDPETSKSEKWLWTALVTFVPYSFVVWFAIRFWRKREKNRQR
jgi:hypothetical protein